MFAELFTPEQLTILGQIILIDLVLAGDNAIIIGMVASKFPVEQRKKIIFWGISGAVILRIILTLLTAYLLQITGLRLIGGLLLLYIVYKLYVDVIKGTEHEDNIKVDNSNFLKAIWTILIADFTMSLDNVLGVAGAAGDHYTLLIFGLILSIILMAFAASLISRWIKEYKWIAWLGLLAILVVAIELIYTDIKIDNSNFLKAIWTILLADFTMSLDNVLGVAGAAGDHYTLLIFGLILSIILMATAANLISKWIKEYKWIAWVGLIAILVVAVELIYTDIKILFL